MRLLTRSLAAFFSHPNTKTHSTLTFLQFLRFSNSSPSTTIASSLSLPPPSPSSTSTFTPPLAGCISPSELLSSDTIYALASGRGKCAVAIVRVSGPLTGPIVRALRSRSDADADAPLPAPRVACLTPLHHPLTRQLLYRAIVLWNPGPRSFTGEDHAELYVHGGPAVLSAVFDAIQSVPVPVATDTQRRHLRIRPAEAGEFSKRAFLNGKLDLTAVEGLADLVHAETEMQRRLALRQMGGALHRLYEHWRARILKSVAYVEASIDFAEDQQLDADSFKHVETEVRALHTELCAHLSDARRGERLRAGVQCAILGRPNAGKSSLLNALALRPAAIVSPVPGTTRDVIECTLNIGGFPVVVADTAGLRETRDPVEIEGVARALRKGDEADLILLVVDSRELLSGRDRGRSLLDELLALVSSLLPGAGSSPRSPHGSVFRSTTAERPDTAGSAASPARVHLVFNKSDLLDASETAELHAALRTLSSPTAHERLPMPLSGTSASASLLSCRTSEGFADLLATLTHELATLCANPSAESATLTQARHRHHVRECARALERYLEAQRASLSPELAAHALRTAASHIGKLTGVITTDELLDVIFRDFCIGK